MTLAEFNKAVREFVAEIPRNDGEVIHFHEFSGQPMTIDLRAEFFLTVHNEWTDSEDICIRGFDYGSPAYLLGLVKERINHALAILRWKHEHRCLQWEQGEGDLIVVSNVGQDREVMQ